MSNIRDMFAVYYIAVFSGLSLSHAAPLACEDLVRPLDQLDPHQLEGRWALVAAGLTIPPQMEFFKRRNSSSINFSNSNATSNILYTTSTEVGGKCWVGSYNISLEGSTLTFDEWEYLTVTFLYTSCQDCVAMRYNSETKLPLRLWLFCRRREVEQKEMEEFRAQVKCLNMPPPVVMDPNKELCPKQADGS